MLLKSYQIIICYFILFTISIDLAYCEIAKLAKYGVDAHKISLSGFSSGGFMAMQMHVSHSKLFVGAGVIAGGPYLCSLIVNPPPSKLRSIECLHKVDLINVTKIYEMVINLSNDALVDNVCHMVSNKVYILAEKQDKLVLPDVVEKSYKLYTKLTEPSNIVFKYLNSTHCFPTVDYGSPCDEDNKELINQCGFNTALEILQHIYEDIVIPDERNHDVCPIATLLQFNQTEFLDESSESMHKIGLDDVGYAFVSEKCKDPLIEQCKLHVVLHGCTQGASTIGRAYVMHTGYNEIAAFNNIILLYPQAKIIPSTNPYGCWDWIGDTGPLFATKKGPQIVTIMNMLIRLSGRILS